MQNWNDQFPIDDDLSQLDPLDDDYEEKLKARNNKLAALIDSAGSVKISRFRVGEKVTGKVTRIAEDNVFIDLGQRSEALLPSENIDMHEKSQLKLGQDITLYVSAMDQGVVYLTKVLSRSQMDSEQTKLAYDNGLPVEAKVVAVNKGGFEVTFGSVKGFVPFSQMDLSYQKKPNEAYLNQIFQFKIQSLKGRDCVLSRIELLKEESQAQRKKILDELNVEQLCEGTVVKIEKFGVFVDLGSGLHGLIPMSELSYTRSIPAEQLVSLGSKVNVKIIAVEKSLDKPRITLSLKKIEQDPWEKLQSASNDILSVGEAVEGRVAKIFPAGAIIELKDGLDGYLHISEMSAKRKIKTPGEVVKPGDLVKVAVLRIDPEKRQISLSLKALESDIVLQELKNKKDLERDLDNAHRGVEFKGVPQAQTSALAAALMKAKKS